MRIVIKLVGSRLAGKGEILGHLITFIKFI